MCGDMGSSWCVEGLIFPKFETLEKLNCKDLLHLDVGENQSKGFTVVFITVLIFTRASSELTRNFYAGYSSKNGNMLAQTAGKFSKKTPCPALGMMAN